MIAKSQFGTLAKTTKRNNLSHLYFKYILLNIIYHVNVKYYIQRKVLCILYSICNILFMADCTHIAFSLIKVNYFE